MATPKFREGQRVVVLPDSNNSSVRAGIYTIIRVMPAEPDGIQYRAKSDMDTHERVLREALLRPATGALPATLPGGTARSTPSDKQSHRKRQP